MPLKHSYQPLRWTTSAKMAAVAAMTPTTKFRVGCPISHLRGSVAADPELSTLAILTNPQTVKMVAAKNNQNWKIL
jgi:hypothetical protein